MRCRDHPYIGAKRIDAGPAFEFMLLQHLQQLGPQIRRNRSGRFRTKRAADPRAAAAQHRAGIL